MADLRAIGYRAIVKSFDSWAPLTITLRENLDRLLYVANELQTAYVADGGAPFIITSGYRPRAYNARIPGAAKKSAHCECQAFDVSDPGHKFYEWLQHQPDLIVKLDIYMERKEWCVLPDGQQWTHVQTRPIPSGNRFFVPTKNKPPGFKEDHGT